MKAIEAVLSYQEGDAEESCIAFLCDLMQAWETLRLHEPSFRPFHEIFHTAQRNAFIQEIKNVIDKARGKTIIDCQ